MAAATPQARRALRALALAGAVALLAVLAVLPAAPAGAACGITITTRSVAALDQSCMSVAPSPAQPRPGENVTLTLQNAPTSAGYSLRWDFGDGTVVNTAIGQTVEVHPYATRGARTVTVDLLDSLNQPVAGYQARTSLVVGTAPGVTAGATSPTTVKPNVAVSFAATGVPGDIGGTIASYEWDFGDGAGWRAGTPDGAASHAWPAEATYPVKVRVTDDLGLTATATVAPDVTVVNQRPVAVIVPSATDVKVGTPITFDGRSSHDPDGSVVSYQWNIAGLGWNAGLGPTAAFTPPTAARAIPIRLRVVDDTGAASPVATVYVNAHDADGGYGSATPPGGGSGGGGGGGGTGAFAASLGGSAIQRLRAAVARGVAVVAFANRPARGTLQLSVSARDARRLRLGRGRAPVRIGSLTVVLRGGRSTSAKVRLTRAAVRALRRTRARVVRVLVGGTIRAGASSLRVSRVVLLRR